MNIKECGVRVKKLACFTSVLCLIRREILLGEILGVVDINMSLHLNLLIRFISIFQIGECPKPMASPGLIARSVVELAIGTLPGFLRAEHLGADEPHA